MRAKDNAYHIECFRCVACSRQLIPGDEFALREDGLFCKADHDVVERASIKDDMSDCESSPSSKNSNSAINMNNNKNIVNNNNNNIDKIKNNMINNDNIKTEKGLSTGKHHKRMYQINFFLYIPYPHPLHKTPQSLTQS